MKHTMDKANAMQQLKNVLVTGPWGTVGPRFFEASDAIAAYFQIKFGLVTFSATSALETILRAWNISFGDEVIVAAWSDPVDAMVTAAVGATPVFADICPETLTLTVDTIVPCIGDNTKAIIVDLPAGNPCEAAALAAFCKEKGIRFILNMGDAWDTTWQQKPIVQYADAAFLDMAEGKTLDVGLAGVVLTDTQENFDLFYAYHNCGRPLGEGSTLDFDSIIGGDLRVAEWQSCLIPGLLEHMKDAVADARAESSAVVAALADGVQAVAIADGGISSCCGTLVRCSADLEDAVSALAQKDLQAVPYYPAMHIQSFWNDAYYEKLTGKKAVYAPEAYPCSLAASKTVLRVTTRK